MQLPRRTLLALTALAACAQLPQAPPVAAEGALVRHRRVRLAPAHTKGFEALLETCVQRAGSSDWSAPWLCYRESPGRYWLVTFADEGGRFAEPRDLAGFVRAVAPDAVHALDALELEVEWEWELQQAMDWCTVERISTETHPKARMMVRTIRPGMGAEFAGALTGRTAFLAQHGYPLPIEGFLMRRGDHAQAVQVVFPRDWSSFHAGDSFGTFVEGLDEPARADYAACKAALMQTMSRAEFHDADLVEDLSYQEP